MGAQKRSVVHKIITLPPTPPQSPPDFERRDRIDSAVCIEDEESQTLYVPSYAETGLLTPPQTPLSESFAFDASDEDLSSFVDLSWEKDSIADRERTPIRRRRAFRLFRTRTKLRRLCMLLTALVAVYLLMSRVIAPSYKRQSDSALLKKALIRRGRWTRSARAYVEQGKHPVDALIEEQRQAWDKTLRRQSTTVADASKEYQRRYGRAPPDGFADWFQYTIGKLSSKSGVQQS